MNSKENGYIFNPALPAKVQFCSRLEIDEKVVYGFISEYATEQGYCMVSPEFFPDLLGLDKTSFAKTIYNLEKEGFISCRRVMDNNTREEKVVYHMLPPWTE